MIRRTLGALAISAGVAAGVCACGGLSLAGLQSVSQPASTPAAAADTTLLCSSVNDPLGTGALGSGPTAQVTMTTSNYVSATVVDVTVIEFGPDGQQVGTNTITFKGPFAPDQTFTAEPESTNGNTASCSIAGVSSDSALTYDNESPVESPAT